MGLESSPAGLEFIDPCSVVRQRPLDYSGSAGLVWAINGGRLRYIEIGQSSTSQSTDRGTSLNVDASTQGTSRCRRIDAGNVTLPWIERGRRPGDV
jgi:hypothetical protein